MATFNVYDDLIVPLGEKLQAEPIFNGVNIYYDRTKDRVVPRSLMPAINYFWISPYEDLGRGSGAASLQTRRKTITFGFGVWNYSSQDPATLDRGLWQMSQDLEDWLYNQKDFDPLKGISIKDPMTGDLDYSGDENNIVGTILVTVNFELFSFPRR